MKTEKISVVKNNLRAKTPNPTFEHARIKKSLFKHARTLNKDVIEISGKKLPDNKLAKEHKYYGYDPTGNNYGGNAEPEEVLITAGASLLATGIALACL